MRSLTTTRPIQQRTLSQTSSSATRSDGSSPLQSLADARTQTQPIAQLQALANATVARPVIQFGKQTGEATKKKATPKKKNATAKKGGKPGGPTGVEKTKKQREAKATEKKTLHGRITQDLEGLYYTTFAPKKKFKTKPEAMELHRELGVIKGLEVKQERKRKKVEKQDQKRREYLAKHGNYKLPNTKKVTIYKYEGKDSDVMDFNTLTSKTAKTFMNKAFEQRKSSAFDQRAIGMNGSMYLLSPMNDILMTPITLDPDTDQYSRDGSGKPYDALAKGLDGITDRLGKNKTQRKAVRIRVGKDIERLSRTNQVKDPKKYDIHEMDVMKEMAVIIRMDKGRAPNATKYIREKLISETSFHDLLVKNQYVGALDGGAEALRKIAASDEYKDNGYESEGSDID
jgi:hypothetical protein